jgi:hypothetical protein
VVLLPDVVVRDWASRSVVPWDAIVGVEAHEHLRQF